MRDELSFRFRRFESDDHEVDGNLALDSKVEGSDQFERNPESRKSSFPFNRRKSKQNKRHNQNNPVSLHDQERVAEFCSRSEAICAELFRRFVPHYYLEPGITFQIGIGKDSRGNTLSVDFLVDGVLVEYHAARFFQNKKKCGDFKDRYEYLTYVKTLHSLQGERRELFQEIMRTKLLDNYYQRRRAMLDEHPMFRRTELIVVGTPEELYNKVIKRFGKGFPPRVESFKKLFLELQETLA